MVLFFLGASMSVSVICSTHHLEKLMVISSATSYGMRGEGLERDEWGEEEEQDSRNKTLSLGVSMGTVPDR